MLVCYVEKCLICEKGDFMKNEKIHNQIDFDNIRTLIQYSVDNFGESTAFSYRKTPFEKENINISYVKLQNDVRALASYFISHGMTSKHIALVGKLSYPWILLYYGAMTSGAVLVPLDKDWTGDDLADTANSADVDYIFADCEVFEKAEQMSKARGDCPLYSTGDLDKLLDEGREVYKSNPETYEKFEIDENALALLVFTSGTTGKGKGVMLTQHSILSDMCCAPTYIDFGKKTVAVLPPHHTYGSSIMLVAHLIIGCEVYISSGLKYVTREFAEQKPEHLVLVPLYLETVYRKIRTTLKDKGIYKKVKRIIKISNALRKIGIDLRKKLFVKIREVFGGKCQMLISGGAPLSPEIFDFYEQIGISVLNGYGITECSPIIAVNRTKNNVRGSVGPALDVNEVKILNPNESGEGEIAVRGDNVMLGYYKDEQATKSVITPDGFFKTGDYGKIGKDERIFITGRSKNLIILSNGKNVYPEEIESELAAIPALLDVIVYEGQSRRGITHNKIVAEIYPDYELLKKRKIEDTYGYFRTFIDDYNRNAVPYKKIGIIKIRETEFPKNTLKKIKRFELDMTIE
jgi:long-chain acyl-CoA synthetase